MEKKRFEKGEKYWCVGEDMNPLEAVCGKNWALDVLRFEAGNCYSDYHECYVMCGKLRAVLKGADVIEMPSEEEMLEARPTFPMEYDPWDAKNIREGFESCYEWLKEKIVK